jgi:hypothetical protein
MPVLTVAYARIQAVSMGLIPGHRVTILDKVTVFSVTPWASLRGSG